MTTWPPSLPGRDRDASALLGVLRGVGQEVPDDLLQPRRVGVHVHRPGGELDRQLVLPLLDEGPDGLDGPVDDGGHVHDFPL